MLKPASERIPKSEEKEYNEKILAIVKKNNLFDNIEEHVNLPYNKYDRKITLTHDDVFKDIKFECYKEDILDVLEKELNKLGYKFKDVSGMSQNGNWEIVYQISY